MKRVFLLPPSPPVVEVFNDPAQNIYGFIHCWSGKGWIEKADFYSEGLYNLRSNSNPHRHNSYLTGATIVEVKKWLATHMESLFKFDDSGELFRWLAAPEKKSRKKS